MTGYRLHENLISLIKTQFLPSSGGVSTIAWMHYLDSNKMYGEKARWEVNKNATCCFEQILEAALHQKAAVWPLISHLINHPVRWTRHAWHWWRRMHHNIWLTSKDLHTSGLCADARHNLEDLSWMMNDRDRWWESVKELCQQHNLMMMKISL